jgi:transposase-like protein
VRQRLRTGVAPAPALAAIAAIAIVAVACGGSKSTAAGAPTGSGATQSTTTPGRGFANRTPPPAIQTSIAEGTPFASFRNGTPPAAAETAIAEGTRPSGFGGGRSFGAIAALATLLNVDQQQLRTELQAQGATIASVAAAHGVDRETLRQSLIDAEHQRLADSVSSGRLTQADADAQQSQYEANIDQLMDSNGFGRFGGPAGGFGGAPPAPAQ